MKELICINCPLGCHLFVDDENGYQVSGNKCPRGEAYGKEELIHPTRTLTSTVKVNGANITVLPVKSSQPIPKDKMFEVMEKINQVSVDAPIKMHQVIIENVIDGIDIIASKRILKE